MSDYPLTATERLILDERQQRGDLPGYGGDFVVHRIALLRQARIRLEQEERALQRRLNDIHAEIAVTTATEFRILREEKGEKHA